MTLIEMAREAGCSDGGILGFTKNELKALEALIRADERKKCAKVCESLFDMDDDSCSEAGLAHEPFAYVQKHEFPLLPCDAFSWVETYFHKTPLYKKPQLAMPPEGYVMLPVEILKLWGKYDEIKEVLMHPDNKTEKGQQ